MSITIHRSGVHTSVQDLGRQGATPWGVGEGGPMDVTSLRLANALVGNSPHCACLEILNSGFELELKAGSLFAITNSKSSTYGPDFPFNRPVLLTQSMIVKLKPVGGQWLYLAIAGGLAVDKILGSYATHLAAAFGGWHGRLIKKGDVLHIHAWSTANRKMAAQCTKISGPFAIAPWFYPDRPPIKKIRFVAGPEWSWLSPASQQNFVRESFRIGKDSNRMGYRLIGKPVVKINHKELISSVVERGTIQLPNDGQPIVLMADSQTVGGYPRIGFVCASDLDALAQMPAGSAFTFEQITAEESLNLLKDWERNTSKALATLQLK